MQHILSAHYEVNSNFSSYYEYNFDSEIRQDFPTLHGLLAFSPIAHKK